MRLMLNGIFRRGDKVVESLFSVGAVDVLKDMNCAKKSADDALKAPFDTNTMCFDETKYRSIGVCTRQKTNVTYKLKRML